MWMVINQGKLQCSWLLLLLHLLSSWLYDKINVVQVGVIIIIRQVCTNKLQFELHKLPSILGCNKQDQITANPVPNIHNNFWSRRNRE